MSIRDEINRLRYGRGAVGMALAGADTGGSQFFITLSPQPHLDGGYTAFGEVTGGAEVLDQLRLGDRIEKVVGSGAINSPVMTAKLCLLALAALLLASALQPLPSWWRTRTPRQAPLPPPLPARLRRRRRRSAVLLGPVTREKVEAAPEWVQAEVDAKPDAAAAQALAAVEPGAEVTVYLGTWCGDSRREVPRFWKAVDAAGGSVPFDGPLRRASTAPKKEPADLVKQDGVRYLPTFIVRRGGQRGGARSSRPRRTASSRISWRCSPARPRASSARGRT